MNTYTVIGIHDGGTENRFAETYECADPSDAECLALADHPDLLIAGVAIADGFSVRMVDDDPAVSGDPDSAGADDYYLTDGAGI